MDVTVVIVLDFFLVFRFQVAQVSVRRDDFAVFRLIALFTKRYGVDFLIDASFSEGDKMVDRCVVPDLDRRAAMRAQVIGFGANEFAVFIVVIVPFQNLLTFHCVSPSDLPCFFMVVPKGTCKNKLYLYGTRLP